MKIVLIGRGRLATNLLPALQRAGHDVMSIDSRTLESLPMEADVFVVSVKDSALQEVVGQAVKGREGQLFVHTAGSMPMTLLQEQGAGRCGVFYPMQTFSKERLVDFGEIALFIEASDADSLQTLNVLAASLTTHVYQLTSDDRRYLHLAAVFACNFANHCYALAADVLQRRGLPFDVLLPLADETARKVHQLPPRQAQTGPAVRYDENVINMQHQLLNDQPDVQAVYDLLSQSIHRIATEQKI